MFRRKQTKENFEVVDNPVGDILTWQIPAVDEIEHLTVEIAQENIDQTLQSVPADLIAGQNLEYLPNPALHFDHRFYDIVRYLLRVYGVRANEPM